jgi:hypothetical protein
MGLAARITALRMQTQSAIAVNDIAIILATRVAPLSRWHRNSVLLDASLASATDFIETNQNGALFVFVAAAIFTVITFICLTLVPLLFQHALAC